MITYTWTISALDCKINENGLQNVVRTVHWRLRGEDEGGTSAEVIGANQVGEPNPDNFTDYESLTKETVVSWLEEVLDVIAYKETISETIDRKNNPTDITLPLPTQSE